MMKTFKPFLLLLCFVAVRSIGSAQSGFTLELSQLLTSFKFNDNEGNPHHKDYQSILTGGYGIGFRYVNEVGLFIKPGIGMRTAGANLLYDERNYSWKLHYADLKLGLGYMTKFKRVNPFFVASGYYAFLLRGIQSLNNENLNITKSRILNNVDYGIILSPGININISDYVSSYIEFNYLKGLANIEKDQAQKSKNFAYGLTIGFACSFTEK